MERGLLFIEFSDAIPRPLQLWTVGMMCVQGARLCLNCWCWCVVFFPFVQGSVNAKDRRVGCPSAEVLCLEYTL